MPVADLHSSVADPFDDVLEARALLHMVARLRPVRRRVLERRIAGLSYAEIAAELGITYTAVILGRPASTSLRRCAWTSTTCRLWMSAWPVLCYTSAPIRWRS
jgi:hypothetical protein